MAAQVIPVDKTFSDGTSAVWPKEEGTGMKPDASQIYLQKLANMWMKEKKEAAPGKKYILDSLPAGFNLYGRQRQNAPKHIDRYLYGHPCGSPYRSVNEFWPHFLWLMGHGQGTCTCEYCSGKRPKLGGHGPAKTGKTAVRRKSRKKPIARDEESTEDIFKTLVHRLKNEDLDLPIREKWSADWQAQHEQLANYLTKVSMQHTFIPRLGEIVLWTETRGDIQFNPKTGTFQIYSKGKEKFVSDVDWRAGVVSQVPDDMGHFKEVFHHTNKETSVNLSGYRIETLPDTNSTDKYDSKQYKYVPLCSIRPMNYWQVFLMGLDERAYHPSINHAMTIMSSMSVLQRNHFKGKWPNATVSCGGMFLGNELLIKGDGVCLLPRAALSLGQATDIPPVTDVLVIKNIEVSLENCNDNLESNLLCEKTAVRVVGKAYTTNKERAWRAPGEDPSAEPTPLTNREVINAFQAVNMRDYGPWYRLHDDEAFCRVSPDLVLGRLYDYAYMKRMFGGTSMSYSMSGVVAGREYGRLTDARIPDGKEWFFGDTRFETLAVATSNGIEVGKFDNARDLKMLRACLHVIDGDATQQDYKDAKVLTRATYGMIGSSHDQETFESVGKISTMVSTALEPTVVPGEETPDLGPETKTDDKSSVGVEEDTVMEDAAQVVEGASLEQDENEKPVSLLSGPSSAGRCRKSFRSGTEHSELSRVSQASISKRRKMT